MKIKIPDTLRITNPRWVKKLETRKTWDEINEVCKIDGKTLAIGDYQCCIVGEALNLFDVDYRDFRVNYKKDRTGDQDADNAFHRGCRECMEWSMSLFNEIEGADKYYDVNVESLEVKLEKFAEHLEDDHPDIIEEAKKRNA